MATKNRKKNRKYNRGVASIPAKGRASHILARSVMRNDKFMLNNDDKPGTVTAVVHLTNKEAEIGTVMLGVTMPNGSVFGRVCGPNDRVWIHETPESYRLRRSVNR